MDVQLTNEKELVTGSTAGIGFALASLLAEEGASVRSRSAVHVDSIGLVVRMCCTNPSLPARTRPGSFRI